MKGKKHVRYGPKPPLSEEQQKLVADNVPLAVYWTTKIVGTWAQFWEKRDAESAAMEGLVRAAQLFQPGRSKFGTYASWWCRQGVLGWVRQQQMAGRLPARPIRLQREHAPRSLGDDHPRGRQEAPEDKVVYDDLVGRCSALMHGDQRSWEAFRRHHLVGETLEEIGDEMGITKERVRQLCRRVSVRLQKELKDVV